MIKKQLGLLAGSVMVAATSNAAITLDGNSLAVFNTAGAGSYYQLVAGSTGDLLARVQASALIFQQQLRRLAVLSILSHCLLLIQVSCHYSRTAPGYNYTEFLYVSEGGGLVYAGDTATVLQTQWPEQPFSDSKPSLQR